MSRINLDLSGHRWQMEKMRPGQGIREELHLLPAEYQGTTFSWNFATVPGDVYTDLYRTGELEDPYFGRNMHKAKWAQEYEWWYSHRFAVPESMKGKVIRLLFEGVDYSCDVWLNGHHLGRHEGMFSGFEFDITDFINFDDWRDGSNMLMIKLDPPPKNYRLCGGKKVNFSGDYFTGLVPFGIWRPIRIEATDAVRIKNVRADVSLPQPGEAAVDVLVEVWNHGDKPMTADLEFALSGRNCEATPAGETKSVRLEPGLNTLEQRLTATDPKLWWPWDMGDQNLYNLDVSVKQEGGGSDQQQEVIGLREIRMEMNPGFTPEETEYPWTFVVNGKRHFLRSACWGGQPSLLYGRNNLKKYEDRVAMVKEANINNLRIFGWHPPEIPDFYRLCDELGITVWTNFTLATQAYSKEDAFVKDVLHECRAIVRERRNHPSQIFWMGGEEVFFSGAHEESGNRYLMDVIGDEVKSCTNVPYGLASPLSSESAVNMGFKPKESIHANEHYYQGGAEFMEEYYPALDCAIVPELTAASAPSVDSLKKFIPEDELWPMGVSWAYHWADIDVLKNLNFEVFDDYRTGSLEEFVEATQIAQGTVIQFALETYRRRKPKMSGVAICHFMTHWPDIKWGVIDYYGEKKRSFDYLKRTYQPLLPSLQFDRRRWQAGEAFNAQIWVVNDYQYEHDALTLGWTLRYQDRETGVAGHKVIDVGADSSSRYANIEWLLPSNAQGQFTVSLVLKNASGEVVADNDYVLLVGDQKAAKAQSLAYLAQVQERLDQFGHNVYRYWPERWQVE
ncbi:glycoside hydrolase family 2 protein [Marinimicrobium sp. C2-29]|uniref:glycoside hydrolase family 2 protein n=1 Tax=Marinimicrobium sp. C2-29 TaxID=3139825 RepID=UPI003138D8E7